MNVTAVPKGRVATSGPSAALPSKGTSGLGGSRISSSLRL